MEQFSPSSSEQLPVTLWHMYIDGAARNNPGPAGSGIYVLKNGEPFLRQACFLGVRTNNQAEYYALLLGSFFLHSFLKDRDELFIFSDSQLLVRQITGQYKVLEEGLKKLHACAKAFLSTRKYAIEHVLRENNVIADQLANEGIDKKMPIPPEFELFCARYAP